MAKARYYVSAYDCTKSGSSHMVNLNSFHMMGDGFHFNDVLTSDELRHIAQQCLNAAEMADIFAKELAL